MKLDLNNLELIKGQKFLFEKEMQDKKGFLGWKNEVKSSGDIATARFLYDNGSINDPTHIVFEGEGKKFAQMDLNQKDYVKIESSSNTPCFGNDFEFGSWTYWIVIKFRDRKWRERYKLFPQLG